MKRLVIFDLDGTLLYTVPDIAAATNHALTVCGYPTHDETAIASFIGNGINKLFERALPEGCKTMEEVLHIRKHFTEHYDIHCADMTKPFPGIPQLLESMQNDGVMIAVASNKYQKATSMLIEKFFPQIRFTVVFGERDGVPRKPDPTIVYDILAAAGIPESEKKDVLYIGDSGVDMQTCINAGIEAVGVTWGCRSRAELEEYSPAHIVDHPSGILSIYRR